jgi:hypothetical protein
MRRRIELISHGKLDSSLAVNHMIESNPSGNCVYASIKGESKLFAIDRRTLKKQETCMPWYIFTAKSINESTLFSLDACRVTSWNLTLGSKEIIY